MAPTILSEKKRQIRGGHRATNAPAGASAIFGYVAKGSLSPRTASTLRIRSNSAFLSVDRGEDSNFGKDKVTDTSDLSSKDKQGHCNSSEIASPLRQRIKQKDIVSAPTRHTTDGVDKMKCQSFLLRSFPNELSTHSFSMTMDTSPSPLLHQYSDSMDISNAANNGSSSSSSSSSSTNSSGQEADNSNTKTDEADAEVHSIINAKPFKFDLMDEDNDAAVEENELSNDSSDQQLDNICCKRSMSSSNSDCSSKFYSKMCEIENTEGLLAIAIKTINLVKRNQLLQRRLTELQLETSEFIQSVMANPENRHFREKLRQTVGK